MPKSRRHRPHGAASTSSFTPQQLADISVLRAVDAAQAAGDPRRALTLLERDLRTRRVKAGHWHPERVDMLLQLSVFAEWIPAWGISRWIGWQALRWLDESNRRRHAMAMRRTLEVDHGIWDVDNLHSMANLTDHDWVYRQLMLFDLGGLQHFLRAVASRRLIARAEQVESWARASMGAYRMVAEESEVVVWRDLRNDRDVVTANLGAANLVTSGECVLGRLVPVGEGEMFECAPLFVPPEVAAEVAREPDDWVSALARASAAASRADGLWTTRVAQFPMLTDIPVLLRIGIDADSILSRGGRAVAGVELLRSALDGRVRNPEPGLSPWPLVAATLLEPSTFRRFVEVIGPADVDPLRRMADRVHEPAAALCRELADGLEVAA